MKPKFTLLIVVSVFTSTSLPLVAQERRPNLNEEKEGKVVYKTNIDFEDALIDGQMKAPMGFFLQGRNKQSLTNMVKLRSHFRQELRNSSSAVKAMVR